MIALVSQTTQERAAIPEKKRLLTIVYIDEAQDYFDAGVGIEQLLNQARKYNVGLVVAHQNFGQLDRKLQAAIMGSTTTKIVGGLSADDTAVFAREMHTIPAEMQQAMRKCGAFRCVSRYPCCPGRRICYSAGLSRYDSSGLASILPCRQTWVRGGEADGRNFANISIVYDGQIRGVCLT